MLFLASIIQVSIFYVSHGITVVYPARPFSITSFRYIHMHSHTSECLLYRIQLLTIWFLLASFLDTLMYLQFVYFVNGSSFYPVSSYKILRFTSAMKAPYYVRTQPSQNCLPFSSICFSYSTLRGLISVICLVENLSSVAASIQSRTASFNEPLCSQNHLVFTLKFCCGSSLRKSHYCRSFQLCTFLFAR